MYCSGCGREVVMNAKFCPQCGKAFYADTSGSAIPGVVRPREGRKIAGVCLGLAQRNGWGVALVRVIALLAGILTFPLGVMAYCIFWIILPEEPLYYPGATTAQTQTGTPQT